MIKTLYPITIIDLLLLNRWLISFHWKCIQRWTTENVKNKPNQTRIPFSLVASIAWSIIHERRRLCWTFCRFQGHVPRVWGREHQQASDEGEELVSEPFPFRRRREGDADAVHRLDVRGLAVVSKLDSVSSRLVSPRGFATSISVSRSLSVACHLKPGTKRIYRFKGT